MHQISGSNLHCKLKTLKVLFDLSLDRLGFLVIDEATNILQFTLNTYGLGYRKGFLLWPEKFTESGLSLACLLLVACQDGNPKDWPT